MQERPSMLVRIVLTLIAFMAARILIPGDNIALEVLIVAGIQPILNGLFAKSSTESHTLRTTSIGKIILVFLGVFIAIAAVTTISREQEFNSAFDQGVSYYDQGKYSQAVAEFDHAIALKSSDAPSYFNRALANANLQNYEQAIVDGNRAIELDPNMVDAYLSLGMSYQEQGEYPKALENLENYVRLAGDKASLLAKVAIAALRMEINQQEVAQAIVSTTGTAYVGTRLGSVPTGDGEVWSYAGEAGEILTIVTNSDITPTLNLLDTRLIVHAPDGTLLAENDDPGFLNTNARIEAVELPEAGVYQIEVRDQNDRYGGPYILYIESSRTTTELTPNDAVGYYYRAIAYLKVEDHKQAIADLNRAIELDPSLADVYGLLGYIYMQREERQKALDNLSQYTRLTGDRAIPSVPTAIALLSTPAATPVMQVEFAGVGETQGEIAIGGGQVWRYEGQSGELLTVQVNANKPASGADKQKRQAEGLLDTRLIIRSTDGTVLAADDDIVNFENTDSRVEMLQLPEDGIYEIEVRSLGNQYGGAYTLVIESRKPIDN